MRRLVSALLGISLVVASAIPAFASPPARNCPNPASGWVKVDRAAWWAESIDGFAIAGIEVYVGGDANNGFTPEFDQFSMDFGFADGQALFEFIVGEQFEGDDPNGDGLVCMKRNPINPANPGFFFSAIDNVAR